MTKRRRPPVAATVPATRSTRWYVTELREAVTDRGWHWPAAFLLVYAFLIREVTVGRLYAFGDYPAFLGGGAIEFFVATWHPEMLGYAQPVNTLPAYVGALTLVGGVYAQNLFYLLLIPGCFLTFRVFLGRFVTAEAARTLGAAVYAVNPVTVGQFANGGANELLSLLGMPLVLHFLWQTVDRDAWAPALKAGAAFGATTIIPWTSFWIVLPYATYLLYRTRRAPRRAAKLVAAGAVGVALTLPNLYYLLLRSESLSSTAALIETVDFTYSEASPLLVARLAGNRGSYAMQVLGYNDDPALAVGLVVPLVGLVAWRRLDVRPFFAAAVLVGGFIVATAHGVTYPIFEAVPPLFSLKNPNKLYYALLVSAGVVFGAGVDELLASLHGREDAVVRTTLIALVVLSLFAYVAPASGGLGLTEARGDDYAIPPEYDAVAEDLDGRVLWLPYSYTTELRLRHVYPRQVGVRSGGVIDGRENEDLVESLFHDVAAGEPVDDRLRALGVRYVVVDRMDQTRVRSHAGDPRVRTMNFVPFLFGEPASLEERFAGSEDYHLVERTGDFSVYRVVDAEPREGTVQVEGLHRVYYPTAPETRVVGDDLVENGRFEDGLEGWWTWSGDEGTQTEVVTREDGERAAVLTTTSGRTYPLAQEVPLAERHPFRIDVDAEGPGVVTLVWYDGEKDAANKVSTTEYPLSELPQPIVAPADLLSVRVKPAGERLVVRSVEVRRTSYPSETGYSQSTTGVPGVTVDGFANDVDAGSTVAVNLDDGVADEVDADVRIVDAEAVLEGELVFGEEYRQGVAVRLPDGEVPSEVPGDATPVTAETPDGTVLDYWVVGEFDETPVTVRYTSYHDGWEGPPGSTHFEAYGWANGFTRAAPDEVHWTGGDETRERVIAAWLLCWGAVLLVLVAVELSTRRRGTRGAL